MRQAGKDGLRIGMAIFIELKPVIQWIMNRWRHLRNGWLNTI